MPPRALLCCAVALLAGCASLPVKRGPAPVVAKNAEMVQAELLAGYTRELQAVVQGNAAEQAELVSTARGNYEQARQGPAVLHYALLLAAPGHPGHDAPAARRLLAEALAHPELLSPVERALAIVEKARVAQELDLAAENTRLVAEAEAQAERERQRNAPSIAAVATRLQAEITENARLKKELDDAKAKLDAIANLERSIPPRPPVNEARKP